MVCRLNNPFKNNFYSLLKQLKWKCIKVLGKGGFGVTLLIEQNDNKKIVAKAIGEQSESDIQNEIKILEKFKNSCDKVLCFQSVFTIKDKGKYGAFLFTEFIDGLDMDDYFMNILKSKKFNKEILLDILIQYIEAVRHIHNKNVVHYDLKPGNVMITKDRKLKIIDFGLSKISNSKNTPKPTGYTEGFSPNLEIKHKFISTNVARFYDYYALSRSFLHRNYFDLLSEKDKKSLDKIYKNLVHLNLSNYKTNINKIYKEAKNLKK